ncbi:MAG TPA: NAD(P)H-dependent oxidoreductase subunit E, partial [Anaerolineae bacterium]
MLKEKRAQEVEAILAKYPTKRSAVMPLLYLAQEEYGYCDENAMREVAE